MTRIWELPLREFSFFETGSPRDLTPYFFDWLQHSSYDDYWKQWSIHGRFDKIEIPCYHVGGWYDIFLNGTLRNYMGISKQGRTEIARKGQRLLIGPWFHDSESFRQGKAGDYRFAPDGCRNEEDEMLRWFDHTLKSSANGLEREKPVKIFVMGENAWREEDEWPLLRARATRLHLHSGGAANALSGDGHLHEIPPEDESADHFVYDPANPVRTLGGGNCCDHDHLPPGRL